jgi:DNA-binding beta-propeller fold protein YncE
MKRSLVQVLFTLLLVCAPAAAGHAAVEWQTLQTLKLEGNPVDIAVSLTGNTVYVLTDQHQILIYQTNGVLKDTITVDASIDGIEPGPREDILFLSSGKERMVRVIAVDFIQEIDYSGSPSRGPAQAPVTIAVFSDFQ